MPMNQISKVLFRGPFGGSVSLVGPRTIHATYPHRFVTFLLLLPATVFLFGILLLVVGSIADNKPTLLIGVVPGVVFSLVLLVIARRRWRSMGTIVLNADEGTLKRVEGEEVLEEWAVGDIERIRKRMDVMHRGVSFHYWLVVELKDGRSLRLGKGEADEVDQALHLMRDWGLPVGGN